MVTRVNSLICSGELQSKCKNSYMGEYFDSAYIRVMPGFLLAMKVMKVIKKSCIFLSGHESHEKVMNFRQNY